MGFRLSRQAEEDLIEIYWQGARQLGIEQARRYHQQLQKCIQFLSKNPRAARERTEITPPVRVYPFGSHLIVYSHTASEEILIIRIRHGLEDWVNDQ